MEIRQAVIGDLPRLAELFGQLGYPNSCADLERRWPSFRRTDADCWLAVKAGQAVGVLIQNYLLPLNTTSEYAVLTAFVVDEALRRSGAGAALLACAEQRARARGCTHIELSSGMHRPAAHQFYERHGFVETRKRYVKAYAPRAAAAQSS
jgi:GNAT superfamily N-acetyltransferase